MSHLWTLEDRDQLNAEIAQTREQIDRLTSCQPVSDEARVARDDTLQRTRRELARLEQLLKEAVQCPTV